tara:strand:+ start:130 stop:369 length:240 start_codon:yes stop_codon:yes gene_type:complete
MFFNKPLLLCELHISGSSNFPRLVNKIGGNVDETHNAIKKLDQSRVIEDSQNGKYYLPKMSFSNYQIVKAHRANGANFQ